MKKESIKTSKGFQVIDLNLEDLQKLGSLCICDSCNQAMFSAKFIGALGRRAYCKECFEKWDASAKYYTEDAEYEQRVTDQTLQFLNS